MSVKVMARVWAHSQQSGGALLVMLALADFANDAGECWPSIPVLAQKARLTEREIRYLLPKLEGAGEVQLQRSNGGRNRRNRYVVTVTENPESISLKNIQGNSFSEICDTKTLKSTSGALNRHRTVSNSASKKRSRRNPDSDPRVNTLLTAFIEKYQARVGKRYVVVRGKDHALLKGLLTAGHDVPAITSMMDGYFAADFYSNAGFDVGGFKSAFNRLNSAGVKKQHDYEEGIFPGAA